MTTHAEWTRIATTVVPRTRAFIDGRFVDAAGGETFPTVDPSTGRVLAEVARCREEDVDRAVASARRAFDGGVWSASSPSERKRVLLALADLLRENAPELAVLDAIDGGKTITDTSTIDVPGSAAILQWYAESVDKIYGEVAPVAPGDLAIVTREPSGVVAAVVPWNHPLEMAIWKVAPALAAGNSVVLKPAEDTPLSALRLAELASEAGLPDGVLNVVPGYGPEAGKALGLHPDVDVVAFTGSTEVGKMFLEYSARSNMKPVWLECGGKSANLVFADAHDLDRVAELAVGGIFGCAGQVCSANSRLLVERSIADDLVARIVARTEQIVVGPALDPATGMGPLVSATQRDRVEAHVRRAQDVARLRTGGRRPDNGGDGSFFTPTIFADTPLDSPLWKEEIFGPVLAIATFDHEVDAVHRANDSVYGLAASVFTSDIDRALRVSKSLRAGTVSVNAVDALDVTTPFGGMKQSGFGRDLSLHALDKFTSWKTTWFAGR